MKKFVFPILAVAFIVGSAFTLRVSQNWAIADGHSIKFDAGDPSGEFSGLKGTIAFDPADLANSQFDAAIDVTTINTGNGMKNTHAKSAMWLDAEKYPVIHFTSSAITKTDAGYEQKGFSIFTVFKKKLRFRLHSTATYSKGVLL